MSKYKITPYDIKSILEMHDKHWEDQQRQLYAYKMCYQTEFWDNLQDDKDMQLVIQTSDAYGYIESYIASLFARNPGVIVKSDVRGRGNPRKAQELANDFLIKYSNSLVTKK